MSANIESYIGRQDAWHGLGTVLGRGVSIEDAMTTGKLGQWNVRKTPLFTKVPTLQVDEGGELVEGFEYIEVPDYYSSTRDNPETRAPESLGVVGGIWIPIQNEDKAAMLGTLVDASEGGFMETAGSLSGGKQVFFSLALAEHGINVGGVDPLKMYLMLLDNFDGKGGFRGTVSGIRPVCSNTVNAALQSAVSSFNFRHTGDATQRVQQAREALRLSFGYVEAFEAEAERMVQETISTPAFMDSVVKIFGLAPKEDDTGRTIKTKRAKAIQLGELFEVAETQKNIRGSKWAAFQAVVEWVDHFIPVNGRGTEQKKLNRETNTILGANNGIKQKAFEAFRVPVGV